MTQMTYLTVKKRQSDKNDQKWPRMTKSNQQLPKATKNDQKQQKNDSK